MRIIKQDEIKQIKEMIESYAKITNFRYSAEDLADYLYTIDSINLLDRNQTRLGNEDLNDFKIAPFMEGFIMPSSITVSGADAERDFRKLSDEEFEHINLIKVNNKIEFVDDTDSPSNAGWYSYQAKQLTSRPFNNISRALMGVLKLSDSDLRSIESIRSGMLLSAMLKRAAHDGYVVYDKDYFYPIELDTNLYESVEYNYDAFEMMMKAFSETLKKVSRGQRVSTPQQGEQS